MAKAGAANDRKSFGSVGGEGEKAGDSSSATSSTQSTASWLKESILGFPRKLLNSITATEPEPPEPVEISETELKVVVEEQWVVLESSSASSFASAESGEVMSSSASDSRTHVNGGTPVSQRKRTAAGSTKSNTSTPQLGTRTSSISSKAQKSGRPGSPGSPLPGPTHSPVQRKVSSGKTNSRPSNLEVQNGGGVGSSSSVSSASPGRGRSNSPTRGAGKGSSSVRSSSPSRSSPTQGGRNAKGIPSTQSSSMPSTARSSSPVRSGGKAEVKGDTKSVSSGSKAEGKTDSGKPPIGKATADIKHRSQRTNSPSLGQRGASNGVSGGSFRVKKKGILVTSSSDVSGSASNASTHSTSASLSNGVPQGSGHPQANGSSRVHPIPSIALPKDDHTSAMEVGTGEGASAFEKVRDTLRISRPKKKKGKKLAYSIVVDPVHSTPEINLHNPGKYEDPFETSYAENGDLEKKLDHDFKPAAIPHNKPEYCDHCGDMAWGLYRQVLKCSRCNFIAHRKCEVKVLMACSTRLEQAILQHDKQVEDVERIAAVEQIDSEPNKDPRPTPMVTQPTAPPPVDTPTPSSSSSTSTSSSENATPPVIAVATTSSSQFMAEKTKLSRKIREYNRKTTPVHHIHIKSTHQVVMDPSSIEYHGFVRVHMSVQRPIHVSTAITRTSWYRLMRPVKERTLNDVDGYDIQTAFYLPLDTNRLVHIQNTTTTKELIQILLKKFCVTDNPRKFSLYEEYGSDCRRLFEEDRPLEISLDASISHRNSKLVLQDNTYSTIQWDAFSAPELGNFIQILQREEELYIAKLEERFSMWRKSIQQTLKDKCMEEQAKKTRKSVSSRLTKSKVSPKPGRKATATKTPSPKTVVKRSGK